MIWCSGGESWWIVQVPLCINLFDLWFHPGYGGGKLSMENFEWHQIDWKLFFHFFFVFWKILNSYIDFMPRFILWCHERIVGCHFCHQLIMMRHTVFNRREKCRLLEQLVFYIEIFFVKFREVIYIRKVIKPYDNQKFCEKLSDYTCEVKRWRFSRKKNRLINHLFE